MLKVIIFDADGVLIPHKRRFSATLAEKHNISIETTLPFFSGPFQECLVGKKDLKEAITPYLAGWGWTKGVDNLLDYWFSLESEIDKELIDYIKKLKLQGVKCFIATNNEKYRFKYMLEEMGFSNVFDRTYASAHVGHLKPSKYFFTKILEDLSNVQENEILLVDDDKNNIEGAKDLGIHVELYTNLENLREKLESLR